MKTKTLTFIVLLFISLQNVLGQDTYDASIIYNQGDLVDITFNGVLITVEYQGSEPSSTYTEENSTPYTTNNAWLCA
jgi:hypothetical protein